MVEMATRIAWIALAAVHLAPAAVLFLPALAERLYGTARAGDVGVLLVHRGALFLGLVVLLLWAAFEPAMRRAASLVAAISVIGFLAVYAHASWPDGPLRRIARTDLLALAPLAPLAWVAWRAWMH